MGKPRRAAVIGTGLLGSSVGLALRGLGWHVSGSDTDPDRLAQAAEAGAIDSTDELGESELTFVATPVAEIPGQVRRALGESEGLVTDLGSVKGPMIDLMRDPRYVGGHPMAGSEQEGPGAARPDLFEGATWVLTPVAGTDDAAFAQIRAVIATMGAEVVALDPAEHDRLVAVTSHVPHLAAATLMDLADESSERHRAVLRLAAGGFRDMTRVASGAPGMWPDICRENRQAIVEELDRFIAELGRVRDMVDTADREALISHLERARTARRALPARAARPEELAEIRVPVRDEAGALARVLLLAAELDVSVADVEIAHSAKGQQGVLVLLVEEGPARRLMEGLRSAGERASMQPLS